MTKKTTYTATDANGTVHTRTTNRTYTNTVVYQADKDVAVKRAHEWVIRDRKDAEYYQNEVAQGEEAYIKTKLITYERLGRDYFARQFAENVALANKIGNPVDYAARRLAERLAEIEATDWTVWHNAGWCGRRDLAVKLANEQKQVAAVAILEAKAA